MKTVILCPPDTRTGGPEALYQLSDMMIENGIDTEFWLLSPTEIAILRDAQKSGKRFHQSEYRIDVRSNSVEEYQHYRVKPFRGWSAGEPVRFVLAEVYAHMIPFFEGTEVLLWWLSVDNALAALSCLNLNRVRSPRIRHGAQSQYAVNFLNGLGIPSQMLTDYTVVAPSQAAPVQQRQRMVAINAGGKVVTDLGALETCILALAPDLDIRYIRNMSRQEVYATFEHSRLFVDMGCFPGKDRMCREALMLGTNILISNTGAGAQYQDYALADDYKLSPYDVQGIAARIVDMVEQPGLHAPHMDAAREQVRNERETFKREVAAFF